MRRFRILAEATRPGRTSEYRQAGRVPSALESSLAYGVHSQKWIGVSNVNKGSGGVWYIPTNQQRDTDRNFLQWTLPVD